MGDTPTFQPNPYANFDPSQWSNPYSLFSGALPWPSSYAGTPTNALGQPIAVPQGMTLNSTPQQKPQQAPSGLNSTQQWWNALSQPSTMNPSGNAALGMANWGAFMGPQGAIDRASPGFLQPGMQGYQGQGGAAAPAAQAAQGAQAAGPPGSNYDTVLAMLANPGHVTTPGATVPQAPSSAQPSPGVLQSFLANWKPQQSGPGSGFQQAFNKALRSS